MSNRLAIATVTAVLREVLSGPVGDAVTGADVLHDRPSGPDVSEAAVNLYAYGVRRNTALSNEELPVRRGDGTVLRRPQIALDIQYLLTFFGEDADLEPQRLLGAVVSALHDQPTLTRPTIEDALAAATGGDLAHPLAASDLARQLELVRLSPLFLDLEAMSKLWSVFFQTQYSLSVAYTASTILIDGALTPIPSLPVAKRGLRVVSFRRPRITAVQANTGVLQPITRSSTLVVRGSQLASEGVQVRIGELLVVPSSGRPDRLEVDLSALSSTELAAGVLPVQVIQPVDGSRVGFESNVVPAVLRPILAVPGGGDAPTAILVQLDVDPQVRAGQRLALMLNGPGGAFQFTRPPLEAPSTRIAFEIEGVPAGDYLVRVSVDGADSPVLASAGTVYDTPTLMVPAP